MRRIGYRRVAIMFTFLLLCGFTIPLISAAQPALPQFEIRNPQSGYPTKQMGNSVAIDGDTMIVGAPSSEPSGLLKAGTAMIYVRDGLGKWTLQSQLIASDASTEDYFGWAVAVSGDTAVIGAMGGDGAVRSSGCVYVFTRSGSTWTQQAKLIASDGASNDSFGITVSLSDNTIIIGAPQKDSASLDSGAVYVFTGSGATWTKQAKLTASVASQSAFFGYSAAIAGDTAIVGVVGDSTYSGSAYVFTRSGSLWTQQQKLTASDAAQFDWFGRSVAISGDTAVVGAQGDDDHGSDSGSAYVFTRSGTMWSQQQKLTAADGAANDYFGIAVAISGELAFVGSGYVSSTFGMPTNTGSVYAFTRTGTTWTQKQKMTAADAGAGDSFGYSLAVTSSTLAVGAVYDSSLDADEGSAYAFAYSGSTWAQQAKVDGPDSAARDFFGVSVSLSGDTALVGAMGDSPAGSSSGSAYVYTRNNSEWLEQQKLVASDATPGDQFGRSVSISGDTAIVGAYAYSVNTGTKSGAAYIFTRSGNAWTQQAKLSPSDGAAGDCFGVSVAISGDTAVVGALYNDYMEQDSGAAYVFTRSNGVWTQQDQLLAADAAVGDYLGYSVSISSDTVAVGAYGDDDGGIDSGSTYIFTRNGSAWTRQAKLTAPDPASSDYFGVCVSLSGSSVVIGSVNDDDGANGAGSAYVFTRDGSAWPLQQKLKASDPEALSYFGDTVCISENTVVVGSRFSDEEGYDSGSVYAFTRSSGVWTQQREIVGADTVAGDSFGVSVAVEGDQLISGAMYKSDPETRKGAAYIFDLAPLFYPAQANPAWALYK